MSNDTNITEVVGDDITSDDATWVLISTYIIFTMQTGFGLLEGGCVSSKNEVNIMFKNMSDVIFGGIAYWFFGYAFSFGEWPGVNPFCGVGGYLLEATDVNTMGGTYVQYVFQLSFATTATTIVSGAMAERVKMPAYFIYAFCNILTYSVVAHWVWTSHGFLNQLGVIDVAGSGVVHLCGGASALVASAILKPRRGRYDKGYDAPPPGNGTNVVVGTFMLWWGWLGFNCGSTYGVEGGLYKLAAKSAVTTLNASMTGGLAGIIISMIKYRGKYGIPEVCNGVLGGLVAITAPCAVVKPWEALVIGLIGGLIANGSVLLIDRMKVDDPVGAISVHGSAGIWGLLSVGLFVEDDPVSGLNNGQIGLFKGGGGYSLGVQALAAVAIMAWSMIMTSLIFGITKLTIGIRMSEEEEIEGADSREHMLKNEMIIQEGDDKNIVVRKRTAFGYRRDQSEVDIRNIGLDEVEKIQKVQNEIQHGQNNGGYQNEDSNTKI